jgi:hypothetical protein
LTGRLFSFCSVACTRSSDLKSGRMSQADDRSS